MLIRKYFLVVGVGFVLTFLGISSNAQEASFELIDRIAEAKSMQFLKSINFIENEIYNQFDLVYQRMEWDIDPEIKHIKGKITSFVVSKKKNLNEIYFDLHQALTVDSVVSKNEQLIFKHENNGLKIFLNRSLNISELDSLTIFYGGIPEETGFGSFVQSSHNSTPIIWTLSEPYGAMEWWPCKQSLLDKVDSIDVIVTCPEIYRTASNGILFSETVNNGKRIMFWKHRYPIATYLVAIAVTNYVEYSEYLNLTNGGKIEILNYVYPESIGYATGKTPRTIEIMELYNDLFGLYPFADEKYGHAQFGWGGGMEHQTMSFMSNFEFGLIAHELAHQWFGDYATLSSWHDIWLNEGFATFATGLAYEKLLDDLSWHEWKQKAVERITNYPAGSVYVQDITNVSQIFNGRLSYSKGGFLLRMLRWVLGDKVLFEGINNYLNDSEVANGFATQEKLIYHLESCADTSLTEFFKDWYYGEGHPVYSVAMSQNAKLMVQLKLWQETTHQSVGFFEMPVEVILISIDRNDSINFRLENSFNGQEFSLDPGFIVGEILLDPELWLISKTDFIVSVPILHSSGGVTIFPNPTKHILNIYNSWGDIIEEVKVFSVDGIQVRSFKVDLNRIDISSLSNGLYLIQVNTSQGTFEQKIVKQ